MVEYGRGAFTRIGKDNGSRYYEYILGKPLDGSSKDRDVNYLGVNLGVKAIQRRINSYGYSPILTEDGKLGAKTKSAIAWIQKKLSPGLAARNKPGLSSDGTAGPYTCRELWRDLITWYAAVHGVPPEHLWGMMAVESAFDPGAVGYTTPTDRGLTQINLSAHPNITVDQAYDPWFAIDYTAGRLANARRNFSGKGQALQTLCSIAQHNAPAWAASWYTNGVAPNEKIALYVENVLRASGGY